MGSDPSHTLQLSLYHGCLEELKEFSLRYQAGSYPPCSIAVLLQMVTRCKLAALVSKPNHLYLLWGNSWGRLQQICSNLGMEHWEEVDLFTYLQCKKRLSLCPLTKMKCSPYLASSSVTVNSFVSSRATHLSHCRIRAITWNLSENSILALVKRNYDSHCSYFFIDQVTLFMYYPSGPFVPSLLMSKDGNFHSHPDVNWSACYCHWPDGIRRVKTTLETWPKALLYFP